MEEKKDKGEGFGAHVMKAQVRSVIALILIVGGGAFLWNVTFAAEGELSKLAEYIVGFVTGSVLAVVLAFYFGSSQSKETEAEK